MLMNAGIEQVRTWQLSSMPSTSHAWAERGHNTDCTHLVAVALGLCAKLRRSLRHTDTKLVVPQ
jgi:hypothetical protein